MPKEQNIMITFKIFSITNGSIIDQTYSSKISPNPSLPNPAKRGTPFWKGREGGI